MSPLSSCAASALTGQHGAELLRQVEGDAEVLAVERDLEPERVVVVDHPAAAVGQHPALGRAAAERPDDLLDVETGLDRQDDALGDAEVGAGEDDLVDRLDRLAGTDRTDVGDRPAEGVEHGTGTLDVLLVAADEDRQRRVPGALAAARDRGIDHAQAAFAQPRGEIPAARWGDRRAVDDRACPTRAPSATPSSPNRTASTSGVSDTQMTTIGVSATASAGVARHLDAELRELGRPARRPVPGGDREAGARQVGGHRRAHRAQPEEGDLLHRRHGTGGRLPDGARSCPAVAVSGAIS